MTVRILIIGSHGEHWHRVCAGVGGRLEKGAQGRESESGTPAAHHEGLGNQVCIGILSKGRDSDRRDCGVWDETIRFMMYNDH